MAQYRLSVTAASRSAGRKVVAMAAYRSGDRLDDRHYGESHDYTNRGGVVHSEIVLPANAPEWASDRAALWSQVESREKADNVTLAREVLLSLPCEFNDEQRIELAQEFAQHVAAEYRFAVDISIHEPGREGDDRNHHCHMMLTTRAFDENRSDGWSKTKDRRFNQKEMRTQGRDNAVSEMREVWEQIQNRALERADIRDERGELVQVDRRSYEERGLEIEPGIHLGYAASAMQRRGEDSDRAQANDDTRQRNAERQDVTHELESDREELTATIGAARRTPLEDHLKYKHRDDPVIQAIYEDFGEGMARWMHTKEARQMRNARTLNEWMQGIDQADEQITARQEKEQTRERLLDTYPRPDDPEEPQRSFGPRFGRGR